jgi:hypothetical protein
VLGKDKKKLAVNLHAKASSYGKRLSFLVFFEFILSKAAQPRSRRI